VGHTVADIIAVAGDPLQGCYFAAARPVRNEGRGGCQKRDNREVELQRQNKTLTQVVAPERHVLSFFERGLHARYFASSFFRIRRSSIKQSAVVVEITQPIMMITFMSIRAGSFSRLCPANASDSFTQPEVHTPKDTAKRPPLLLAF